jgi:hypothetical protein
MAAITAVPGGEQAHREQTRVRTHVALIVFSGLLVRALFYLAYKPIWAGDSPSYTLAYYFWTHRQFYLGERTPIYPLMLGLAQWVNREHASILPGFAVAYTTLVWQAILNILTCVGFYFTLLWLRVRRGMALAASIVLVTLAGLCWYEMQILNMALAFTFVTVVAGCYVALLRRIEAARRCGLLALATGGMLGIAVLVRPELLIFTVVLVLGTAALRMTALGKHQVRGRKFLASALLMMIGVAPLLLLWMAAMYAGIGEFRITTLDGWNKSRTVYNLFDRVGPEDHALGEVLSRSYAAQLTHGNQVNVREHMFIAFDDLKAHYNEFPIDHSVALRPSEMNVKIARLAFDYLGLERIPCAVSQQMTCFENMRARIDLGDYIGGVSSKLMRRYPGAWARNTLVNWLQETFNFSYVDRKEAVAGFQAITVDGATYVRRPRLSKVAEWAVRVEAPLLSLAYVVTLLFAMLGPVLLVRDKPLSSADAAVVLLAMAAVGTEAVMCAIAGFNRIYSLPFVAIFVLCAAFGVERRRDLLPISPQKAED